MNRLTQTNPRPFQRFQAHGSAKGFLGWSIAKTVVKSWIKKLPFFLEMDYFRRRAYESPLFDMTVKPLADTLAEWPKALVLDITNRCNAKCVWCPQPRLKDLGAMQMPLFKKIIDNYATRGGIIRFGTFGEPLMDKTFVQKIEYLKQFPSIHKVELLTNAFFLNEKISSMLIDNGVDVEISLDELEKTTFEEIKKMSYDVVRTNILRFLELNDAAQNPVRVNFRVKSSLSRKETMAHELFAKITAHQCTVEVTPIEEDNISNWAGEFDKDSFYEEHMHRSDITKTYNYKQFNLSNTAPCNQLWKWLVVNWDGRVVLCCVDMFATEVMGDLQENTIEEIWNGPVLTELREKMVQRKRFEIPTCKNCDLHLGWQNLKIYYNKEGEFISTRNFIS